MTQITINNHEVNVVEYKGQRVITFKMIDELHERPEGTAGRNFRENRERFVLGEDYIEVCADEIRRNKIVEISAKAHRDVTLLTSSGYAMLAKSLTDDLSWTIQRELVRSYFKPPVSIAEETPEELALRAMTMLQDTVARQKLELEVANERAKLQQAELESVKPKADALDRISIASGEYGLTETAKIIQIKPGKFFDWLDANRCRYARGKVKLAYQDKIDAGYFRNRATFYMDDNGEQQAGNTIRVTPKGLAWLARVVPGAELDPAFKHGSEVAQPPFTQASV